AELTLNHGAAVEAARETCVIETHGAAGAICHFRGGQTHAPGFMTECVDPTGAGDHFAACFMMADQAGLDLRNCLEIANLGGMIAVETIGARAERFDLDRLVDEMSVRRLMR
ncbi:MAG: PfkB family carbohydrate kinase, partial [Geminicoccaceae bacterium]